MGSSLTVINDTGAPIYVHVGIAWDILGWSLTGILAVVTAGAGIAAGAVGLAAAAPAAVAAGTAAGLTTVGVYLGGTSAIAGLVGASSALIFDITDGDMEKYQDCLTRQREVKDALNGYTKVNPGHRLPEHWGSLSLVQSAVLIDNTGVAFQRHVWTGPTANSNHEYFAREHFGEVNPAGRDQGATSGVINGCELDGRRRAEDIDYLAAPAPSPSVGVESLTADDEETRLLAWMSQSFSENQWTEWAPFVFGRASFEETCDAFGDKIAKCGEAGKCTSCLQSAGSCDEMECFEYAECNKVQPCMMVDYECATEEQSGGFVKCLNHLDEDSCEHTQHFDSAVQCFLDVLHAHEKTN